MIFVCPECGSEITMSASAAANRKFCSYKCRRAAIRRAKGIVDPPKTDWAEIGRLQRETGMSYGQLEAKGLLPGGKS